MATANDGRSPYESGAAEERVCKRPFRPEIYEEPQHVSHEAGRNNPTGASELRAHHGGNSASISAATRISKLEQMMKQMTFTRSETQRLISLLHSRTIEESQTPLLRLEASTTTGLMKRHKHGDDRDNFHASVVSSRVLEEEIDQDSKFNNKNGTGFPLTSMASPQQPMTIENLPQELLSNIFIRLLPKQLAQMRSVSRSWNALLSQSSFVKSHLHHSIHNNNQILLVFHAEELSSSDFKPFTAKLSRSPHLELTNFIKLPVNQQSEDSQDTNGIRVIGSINGLICSRYGDSIIHIWNPSLSAILTLPPYSTPSYGYNSIKIHFRFGFDPKSDDYKVVKLTGLTGPYINAVTWWLQVEIYSMRKGSWELITGRFPSHIATILDGDHVCVDGHDGRLHWLGYNYISEKCESGRIVAFDLGSETFCEIPLPDSVVVPELCNQIGVLAEKLCVISCIEDAFEVWVMDEYGVAESWVKRHTFSQFSGDIIPLGFTTHSEFLIEGGGYLVWYNPSTNEQIILEDPCPEEYGIDKVVEYVDSLVWVAPEHQMVDGGQN